MNSIISKELIALDLEATSKEQAIIELSKLIEKHGSLVDFKGYVEEVFKREETSTTSVVFDIAIPHGRGDSVRSAAVAFARLKHEVLWSEEGKAKYIFLIAAPEKEIGDTAARIITGLARRVMREEFRAKLKNAVNADELLGILAEIF